MSVQLGHISPSRNAQPRGKRGGITLKPYQRPRGGAAGVGLLSLVTAFRCLIQPVCREVSK